MDLTDKYFSELLSKKESCSTKDELSAFYSKLNDTMEDLFFKHQFSITGTEICSMLDITEYYFFLNLKDKVDYIVAPKKSTQFFNSIASKLKLKYSHTEDDEKKAMLYNDFLKYKALVRKKVFINRTSLFKFLMNELKIEYWNIQIILKENEYSSELKKSEIDKIVSEYKQKFLSPPTTNIEITESIANDILEGNIKLLSGKHIKHLISTKYDNPYQRTIHNVQLYRFLKNEVNAIQFTMLIANEKPIVRYAINEESLIHFNSYNEKGSYIFSIPSCYDPVKVKEDILQLLNN